ncbi:MAG TPA: phosphatidylglycerophosphatase A [Puia sp.]|nr:phosphatidylglycerophosphatase A [Puia sp.]
MYKLISACFGVGYIKGGGTIAALVVSICWYFICKNNCSYMFEIAATILITAIGIWASGEVEKDWGKDSSKVVIDEAAGMCVSLLFLPTKVKYVFAAFILFRFFDIAKPLYIRRLEKLPRGWGVMADDLLSGIYSNLIMQIIIAVNLF